MFTVYIEFIENSVFKNTIVLNVQLEIKNIDGLIHTGHYCDDYFVSPWTGHTIH